MKLLKKSFIVLLSVIANGANQTTFVSLSNHKCMIEPTLINLHPNVYSQEFHYYPFAEIDVLEAIILLMTYLLKYVFQMK